MAGGNADRVLDLLAFIADQPNGASLRDISLGTATTRATAHRVVTGLVRSGWLTVHDSPARYSASRKVVQLGLLVLRNDSVREAILPNAIDLARSVSCVCMLAFYEAGDAVYTDAIEVFGERVMPTPSGTRTPAYATACGKILLSYQTPEQWDEALDRASVHAAGNPAFDRQALYEELVESRDRGYALSRREFRENASGIAVPVFGRDGRVAAAIGVHSDDPVGDSFINRVLPTAVEFSRKASVELGHRLARRSTSP